MQTEQSINGCSYVYFYSKRFGFAPSFNKNTHPKKQDTFVKLKKFYIVAQTAQTAQSIHVRKCSLQIYCVKKLGICLCQLCSGFFLLSLVDIRCKTWHAGKKIPLVHFFLRSHHLSRGIVIGKILGCQVFDHAIISRTDYGH